MKCIRLEPRSAAKTGILRQLAYHHVSARGYAYPGIDYLAESCGCARSTMIQHLNDFACSNPPAIVREHVRGGRGRTTHYRLPWVDRFRGYVRAGLEPPKEEFLIEWTSTAARRSRKSSQPHNQSDYPDCLVARNGAHRQPKQSEDVVKTVRNTGLKDIRIYKNSNTGQEFRRTELARSIAEIISGSQFGYANKSRPYRE